MILEAKDISFSYGKVTALRNIDLTLSPGEMLGLVGPNGSGKSTLIKCLNGILRPDSGTVMVCGDDAGCLEPREIARRISYVPQEMPDFYSARVLDAVLMGRVPYLRWQPSNEDIRITADVLRALDMESFAMRDVARLSGGERQKVMIAIALAQTPKILLMDEPTSNLDLRHQFEVMDIVKKETRKGLAALVSIHDLNYALKFCDRFIMLDRGRVFAQGGSEIFTKSNIRKIYGINVSVIEKDGKKMVVPESLV